MTVASLICLLCFQDAQNANAQKDGDAQNGGPHPNAPNAGAQLSAEDAARLLNDSVQNALKSKPAQPKPGLKLSEDETANAIKWIAGLGATKFHVREQSAEKLYAMGNRVVPLLRKHRKQFSDVETRLRIDSLVKQLNDGDLESRIDSFLDGEEVELDGWPVFRIMFGESPKSRELFVQLFRDYPDLIESFRGTPRDRAIAMTNSLKTVKAHLRSNQLSVSDAIALLLPATDPNVPLSESYEQTMIMVLRMNPIPAAHKDQVIGPSFSRVTSAWMVRSTLRNRSSVFSYALQNDLNGALHLAVRTLAEVKDPEMLCNAMQVIARFGAPSDAFALVQFLDDQRPAINNTFRPSSTQTVELQDVAMAAIGLMNDLKLSELGLPDAAEHKSFVFIYEDLVYLRSVESDPAKYPDQQRAAAKTKINKLLKKLKAKSVRLPVAPPPELN